MASGICPRCGVLRDMIEATSEREVKDAKGQVYKIVTVTHHCASCNSYVNSRDISVPIKMVAKDN